MKKGKTNQNSDNRISGNARDGLIGSYPSVFHAKQWLQSADKASLSNKISFENRFPKSNWLLFANERCYTVNQSIQIKFLQNQLLNWYATHGRDLPWRQTTDPYRILVSEIMLHQTQVDRVIPKYHQFLEAYPSFEALATASLDKVKALWRPLGYNFRPGRLLRIAQQVVHEFNGKLPDTLEGLLALRGIGRYTAGAILSFAFQKDAPIVDTNVRRVLQRVFGITGNPMRQPAKGQIWELATAIIPSGQAPVFNQALLDFGALICTARTPSCPSCILQSKCEQHKSSS
jgi:A/G-specific adenine glycosylase